MQLKKYLKKYLNDHIKGMKIKVAEHQKNLRFLEKINTKNVNYTVYLHSLWEMEGEKSTTTQHKGSLEQAIKNAEREFKIKNKRTDIQAEYKVYINLGNLEYLIPKEFWKEYKEK